MSEPLPSTDRDMDARLHEAGARLRVHRERCPHPDALFVRTSELADPAFREAVAQHLEACPSCAQMASDHEAIDAATPDIETEARVLARVRAATHVPRWRLPLAAAIVVACAAGAVWWAASPDRMADPETATRPAGGSTPVPSQVVALWSIEPAAVRIPMSDVGATRSGHPTAAVAPALLDALAPYQAGRYSEAARALEAVMAAHPDSADAAFYLGVAKLLAERPTEALTPLERAARLADRGRRDEIEWYRATAEQRAGLYAPSRTRLLSLCETKGDYGSRACAAAETLR